MKRATIQRVPYACSIFGSLKPLIPIGVNVKQISESEHDSRVLRLPSSPGTADLEALREHVARHATTEGAELFIVAALKPGSQRITLVFESSKTVTANLLRTLLRIPRQDCEIYLASASFKFGIFIRNLEILVWEAE